MNWKEWIKRGIIREVVTLLHWMYFNPYWGIHVTEYKEHIPKDAIVVFRIFMDSGEISTCLWKDAKEIDAFLQALEEHLKNENLRIRLYNHKGYLLYKIP